MTEIDYSDEIRAYRSKMDNQLRASDGWLTLAGLHWLKEGENKIDSAFSNQVPLPPYTSPQETLVGQQVFFVQKQGVELHPPKWT